MELRPYQVEAIAAAREQLRSGKKRVLLVIPTGGGKTVIASEIIRSATSKGSRVLFLAHRRELILQTGDKLNRFGVRHGTIMAGFRKELSHPVQVASVQTLIRAPDLLKHVDLIFLDEAHHATTENTYADILKWYPQAKVVGLTATPWRLDGHGLSDVFDGHVIGRTPKQLRDEGFLVPVGGWEYEGIDTSEARVKNGDYVAADLAKAATSSRVIGDIVAEWLAHANGARTVLFATNVEQSQLIVAEFQRAQVPAEHVDGTMGAAERDAVLARLKSGQTRLVSNCNVLTEGWDCPEAEVCVLARPTLSTSLALQMIGRVLRPAPGKTSARLHDHAGILQAHGHPYAERDYSPELSVKGERKSLQEREANGEAMKRCPACKSVRAGWPCDACGFSPSPTELRLEFEEAAAKREIGNDGLSPQRKRDSDSERREKWALRYGHDDDRTARYWFFQRMVQKHGLEKGARVFKWVSGFSDKPDPKWLSEAQQQEGTAA